MEPEKTLLPLDPLATSELDAELADQAVLELEEQDTTRLLMGVACKSLLVAIVFLVTIGGKSLFVIRLEVFVQVVVCGIATSTLLL